MVRHRPHAVPAERDRQSRRDHRGRRLLPPAPGRPRRVAVDRRRPDRGAADRARPHAERHRFGRGDRRVLVRRPPRRRDPGPPRRRARAPRSDGGRRGHRLRHARHLQDRPLRELPRPVNRRAGVRADPGRVQLGAGEIGDRHRRVRWFGSLQRQAHEERLRARAAHRLHLHRGGRGVRLRRWCGRDPAVRRPHLAACGALR